MRFKVNGQINMNPYWHNNFSVKIKNIRTIFSLDPNLLVFAYKV